MPQSLRGKIIFVITNTANLSHTASRITSDMVYRVNRVLNRPPTRQLSNLVLKQGVS